MIASLPVIQRSSRPGLLFAASPPSLRDDPALMMARIPPQFSRGLEAMVHVSWGPYLYDGPYLASTLRFASPPRLLIGAPLRVFAVASRRAIADLEIPFRAPVRCHEQQICTNGPRLTSLTQFHAHLVNGTQRAWAALRLRAFRIIEGGETRCR